MTSKSAAVVNHQIKIIDGHTPQIAIFQTPPTNTAVQNIEWLEYQPLCINTGQSCSTLEFNVPGSGAHYFDLSRTRLYVKVKIVKKDGSNLPADAKVGPVNLMHSTLFSNADVTFQHQNVSKLSPPQYA